MEAKIFSYPDVDSFIKFVLERGSLPFLVRGNLECEDELTFRDMLFVGVYGPTLHLAVTEKTTGLDVSGNLFKFFVHELNGEVVFRGEISLPEKTPDGILAASLFLERWADLLCLAMGDSKIRLQFWFHYPGPNDIESSRQKLNPAAVEKWEGLWKNFLQLEGSEKEKVKRGLWWYRKACSTTSFSIFDSYTANWNSFEILCNVSGNRINKGPEVDKVIQDYLRSKKEIKAGHIDQCFKQFVSLSIPRQIEESLGLMIGKEPTTQIVHECFNVAPKENRLYQIRNDINHGNIHEGFYGHRERVKQRGVILSNIVRILLNHKLGYSTATVMHADALTERLSKSLTDS